MPAQDSPVARRLMGAKCKEMIEEAKNASAEWRATGDEIMRYGFAKDYNFEYINISPNAFFRAKYAKTAEAFQQLGPRLAPLSDITRLLSPRSMDPGVIARTQARMAYLNYTPMINRYANQRRQVINDATGYGTGVMWTGRDPRTGLITSMWDPIGRTMRDAQARMPEDVRVVYRKRIRARQEVMREYPDAAADIEKIPDFNPGDTDRAEWLQAGQSPPAKGSICYYECWFNRGLYAYEGGSEILSQTMNQGGYGRLSNEQKRDLIINGEDQPMVYLVSEDGYMFHSFEWPIPFHLMPRDGWPCTFFDLYTGTDPLHPMGPLSAATGIQRAMNHLVTLMMGKARFHMRTGFVIKNANRKGVGKDNAFRIIQGADIENIEIDFGNTSGDQKVSIKDYVEKLDWGMNWLPSTIDLLNTLERIYERLTPLSEFLATGAGAVQDRSAEATRVRDRNQMARMEDLKDMVRDADTMVARKECFAASYLLNEEDVAKTNPSEAPNWGFLAEPEAKDPNYWIQQLPPIAQSDPEFAQQFAMTQASQAYTMDEVIYQTDFSIEASSSRRKDIDQQLELLDREANTVWPLQLQSGDPFQMAIAYDGMALQSKLSGMDLSIVRGREEMAQRFRDMAMNPPLPPAAPVEPIQ